MSETEEMVVEGERPEIEPQGSRWAKAHHLLLFFVGGLVGLWLLTGFYKVDANQVAIVERLGQFISGEQKVTEGPNQGQMELKAILVPPGQHYHLPWPIDTVYKVDRQTRFLPVTDFFSSTSAATAEFKKQVLRQGTVSQEVLDSLFDPYLITADKNILNVAITVGYQITDPEAYLMSVSHKTLEVAETGEGPKAAITQMAAHVLIRTIAKKPADFVLGEGKEQLVAELRDEMRAAAPRLNLGIMVENVSLDKSLWPAQVNPAFVGVTQASYNAQTAIANAQGYANKVRSDAEKGDVPRILAEAEGYRQKVVKDATGEMDRFQQVYVKYKAAPEITKLSLYSDAVSSVLKSVARTVFVQDGQEAVTLTIEPVEEKRTVPTSQGN